jgi:hypothetical protein
MTHFTVIVCLDDPADVWKDLAAALAPFDQNREVDPYREPLRGEPAGYRGLFRDRDLKQLERDRQPLTWAHVVEAHNASAPDGNRWVVDESGAHAFELTTYNPDSEWDAWGVGGDGSRGHFRHHEGQEWQVLLGHDEPWDRTRASLPPGHCHGGPKASLDLGGLRAEHAAAVAERHDRWLAITAGTAEARPWRDFQRQATETRGYSTTKAERDYLAQPRVRALAGTEFDFHERGCLLVELQQPRDVLLEQARLAAVPGWAVLTTDGRWLDRDDDPDYLEHANAYVDTLPDRAWLIAVDCHI